MNRTFPRAALSALLLTGAALAQTTPAPTTPAQSPSTQTPSTQTVPAPAFKPLPFLSQTPVRAFKEPGWVVDPAKTYRAVLQTSKGDVTVELYPRVAPKAVNNFVFLALNHFYDGTRFHRVIDGFMAQGGDGLSADPAQRARWGTGSPGYGFFVELDEGLKFDAAGVLAMARAQSYFSQGSQFFVTLAPADFLNGNYTIFGRVVAGQDVLAKLTRTARSGAQGEQAIPDAQPDVLRGVQILSSP
ncbi:peptidylprolyl isomerase [Deinococcus koreensis]|uniref:Peptidyl-prolyl cis-trans isomerase n=1 Tax=Deinococcus koreensis TaxID=2054903 RepID=A0A2K3UYV9_9DEIO|nr:peptidylprolyl isomerase [Deinococcus koreensis]PNY81705.1 peptidylprolyl isomerase [Deinococcus koreensis]